MGCFSSKNDSKRDESQERLLNGDTDDDDDMHGGVTAINDRPNGTSSSAPVTHDDIIAIGRSCINTQKGKEVMRALKDAYAWNKDHRQSSVDFQYKTNVLFNMCEQHLSEIGRNITREVKDESDVIVEEILQLRDHWGPALLPLSMRNAFVRERITLRMGPNQKLFQIDCIQFFEPIVFYGNQSGKQEDLVKLFVFILNDVDKDQTVIRYYLERSYLFDFYHVLCFFHGNNRGQLKPYGPSCPSYWEIRNDVIQNARQSINDNESRLINSSGMSQVSRNSGPIKI